MKTKHCDECLHSYTRDWDLRLYCNKGHKPRFYAPKTISKAQRGDFGWKRKCKDFDGRVSMRELIDHCLYESGLTADGCWDELDDYAKEAIERFARLLVQELADQGQE